MVAALGEAHRPSKRMRRRRWRDCREKMTARRKAGPSPGSPTTLHHRSSQPWGKTSQRVDSGVSGQRERYQLLRNTVLFNCAGVKMLDAAMAPPVRDALLRTKVEPETVMMAVLLAYLQVRV